MISSMVAFLICMVLFRSIQKEFQLPGAFFAGFRRAVDVEKVIVNVQQDDAAPMSGNDGADELDGLFFAELGHGCIPES